MNVWTTLRMNNTLKGCQIFRFRFHFVFECWIRFELIVNLFDTAMKNTLKLNKIETIANEIQLPIDWRFQNMLPEFCVERQTIAIECHFHISQGELCFMIVCCKQSLHLVFPIHCSGCHLNQSEFTFWIKLIAQQHNLKMSQHFWRSDNVHLWSFPTEIFYTQWTQSMQILQ